MVRAPVLDVPSTVALGIKLLYEEEPELGRMEEHAARIARAHPGLQTSFDTLGAWLLAP